MNFREVVVNRALDLLGWPRGRFTLSYPTHLRSLGDYVEAADGSSFEIAGFLALTRLGRELSGLDAAPLDRDIRRVAEACLNAIDAALDADPRKQALRSYCEGRFHTARSAFEREGGAPGAIYSLLEALLVTVRLLQRKGAQ